MLIQCLRAEIVKDRIENTMYPEVIGVSFHFHLES